MKMKKQESTKNIEDMIKEGVESEDIVEDFVLSSDDE